MGDLRDADAAHDTDEGAPTDATPAEDLVVSYCFPPYVDTAAIVAAKRVRERGRRVDVLQNRMASVRGTDPGLAQIADHLVVRRHQVPTSTLFASWNGVESFTRRGVQRALTWDRDGAGYRRMYSRAHFAASHILAARIALTRPQLSWTAEFSDPLSRDVTGAPRHAAVKVDALLATLADGLRRAGVEPPADGNLFSWAEHLPFALADTLLFTNEHQRDLMVATIADRDLAARVLERAVVSPHPTLPPEFYAKGSIPPALPAGRTHIGYFGNVYATRGLGTVLAALEALPAELRGRLCLHVFTSEHEPLATEVAARGLRDVVRVGPFAGYLDFLALCRAMDVLLVTDAVTSGLLSVNPFLPSKWSDYRGSGTPVWGIVEPGSVLAEQPLAFRSPVDHATAALAVLAQLASLDTPLGGDSPR